jgi:hypothetical protein
MGTDITATLEGNTTPPAAVGDQAKAPEPPVLCACACAPFLTRVRPGPEGARAAHPAAILTAARPGPDPNRHACPGDMGDMGDKGDVGDMGDTPNGRTTVSIQ